MEILGANNPTHHTHPPTQQNPANLSSIYKKYLNHPLGLTLSTPSLVTFTIEHLECWQPETVLLEKLFCSRYI